MARFRKRGGGRRRKARRSRRSGGSIFGMFRMIKSWRFWAMFAIAGTLLAAFWRKPLELMEQGAAKVKEMVGRG